MERERDETIGSPGDAPIMAAAGDGSAGEGGPSETQALQKRIDAMREQAPDGKFTEHAIGGDFATSGGTGGPAEDPADKGAYGGGGT